MARGQARKQRLPSGKRRAKGSSVVVGNSEGQGSLVAVASFLGALLIAAALWTLGRVASGEKIFHVQKVTPPGGASEPSERGGVRLHGEF